MEVLDMVIFWECQGWVKFGGIIWVDFLACSNSGSLFRSYISCVSFLCPRQWTNLYLVDWKKNISKRKKSRFISVDFLEKKKQAGWWFEPLWKILVNWDDYSQYMGKQKMATKPPTSKVFPWFFTFFTWSSGWWTPSFWGTRLHNGKAKTASPAKSNGPRRTPSRSL